MAERSRGEIYDLGYRRYDGPRLGRAYAIRSLIVLSVRNTFGLGRGALPKVLAWSLTLFAVVPALIQLMVAAVIGTGFEVVSADGYFAGVQAVLVLFIAVMAADLIGNDRKNNTLPLYFSRPIERDDYALAKVTSLGISLLALTLLPLLVLFVAGWLGAADSGEWFLDNVGRLPSMMASSVMASAHLAAVGVLIASFTARRAYSVLSVLGSFLASFIITGIVVGLLNATWAGIVMMLSPLHVMRAVSSLLLRTSSFDPQPRAEGRPIEQITYADLPEWMWFLALVVQTGLALLLVVRRYRRFA